MSENTIDPNVDFDGHLAAQIEKQHAASAEPTAPAEPEPPTDPSRSTADEIKAQVLAPDDTLDSGLEVPPEPKEERPPLSPERRKVVEDSIAALAAKDEERFSLREENAIYRFQEAMATASTDAERLHAARALKEAAPRRFAELVDDLDNASFEELEALDLVEDFSDTELSGQQLANAVAELDAQLKNEEVRREEAALRARRDHEYVQVVDAHYRARGATTPQEIAPLWEQDKAIMRSIGVEPTTLAPVDLREMLLSMAAGESVYDEEVRRRELQRSIMEAPSTSVDDGWEKVNDQGELVSLSPGLRFEPLDTREFNRRVANKLQQAAKPTASSAERQAEFRRAMTTPERTEIRNGWTTKEGKPFDLEGELAKAEREKQARERRERAAELGL